MKKNLQGIIAVFLACVCINAQDEGDFTTEIGGMDFKAGLSFGFNYDFVESPLNVSFDYRKAFFGINIPLKYTLPQSIAGNLTSELAEQFSDSAASEEFVPEVYAKQNSNYSIKVDIPMMGGVVSFSNMQMMYIRYVNVINVPTLEAGTGASGDVTMFMRGAINVPIDLAIGWEAMTFGYAYEVNDKLRFAFNLHRHTFTFDLKGKVDVNILGDYSVNVNEAAVSGKINYNLHNVIDGHYEVERWTPTFAVKYWRFALVSRFGMNTRPSGSLTAKYSLPYFVDPETFAIDEGLMDQDQDYMVENFDKLRNNETNTVEYSTKEKLVWKMPQAHTISFDIIPDKLSLSYTKLFGSIYMELSDPFSDKAALLDTTEYPDTLDFRFEASVDHMLLFHGSFYSSFFNLGIYSMDFAFRDKKNLLSSIEALEKIKFGDGIMTPILNFGVLIGAKLQVLAEVDLLPLTAMKTGIVYSF